MSYSSLIFASVILPVSVLLLFLDRSAEYKNLILCIVSVLFVSWGRSIMAALIFLSVIADFIFGIAAEKSLGKEKKAAASVLLFADLIWNVTIFMLFTRSFLFAEGSALSLRAVVVPVGAAFYALKNFSYVFDVYSGRCSAEKNPFVLMTYSMAYPFLLAGPVVRYGDIAPQLRERTLDMKLLSSGLTRFSVGFAKTVLVVPVLNDIYLTGLDPNEPTLAGAWIGMAAFFGSAYFTFMGLSDMGTGIARLNGFDVDVNYTPLNASRMLGSLIKSYNTSMVRLAEDIRGTDSSRIVMLTLPLTVLGAAFYSSDIRLIIAGAIAGVLLTAEALVGYDKLEKLPVLLKFAVTFIAAALLFSPIAFDGMSEWRFWLGQLFGRGDLYILSKALKNLLINNCFLLGVALISVFPIKGALDSAFVKAGRGSQKAYASLRTLSTVCTAMLLVVSFISLAARTAA